MRLLTLILLLGTVFVEWAQSAESEVKVPPHYYLRLVNLTPFGSPLVEVLQGKTVVFGGLRAGVIGNYSPMPMRFKAFQVIDAVSKEPLVSAALSDLKNKQFITIALLKRNKKWLAEIYVDAPGEEPPKTEVEMVESKIIEPRLRVVSGLTELKYKIEVKSVKTYENPDQPIIEVLPAGTNEFFDITVSYLSKSKETVEISKRAIFAQFPQSTLFVGPHGPTRVLVSLQPDSYFPPEVTPQEIVEMLEAYPP